MTGALRMLLRRALPGGALAAALLTFAGLAAAQSTQSGQRPPPLLQQEPDLPAEDVVTRGWGHSKFGRLVFDWRGAVTFRAQIVDGQLRVTFDRPLNTSLANAGANLSTYLADLRLIGGKVVTARLKGNYKVRSFANDNAVVIDLVHVKDARVDPEVEPASWKERVPVVPVRAGKHPEFGRLVFDWDGDVGYEFSRDGNTVRIRFDRPAKIDVSQLGARLPGRVLAATSDARRTEVHVGLVIPEKARVRHFRDGTRIAVDVIAPGTEAPADAPLHALTSEPDRKPPKSRPVSGAASAGDPKVGKGAEDGRAKPVSLAGAPPPAPKKRRAASAPQFKGAPLVTVDATRRGAALDMRFNWRKPVAAAVYRRGENVWAVFADRARFALGGLEVAAEGVIEELVQTEAGTKSVVKMTVPKHLLATVSKSGHIWNIRLAPARMTGPVENPLQVEVVSEGDRSAGLVISAKGVNRPFQFLDPVVGDALNVYPVAAPGVGNRVARRLVELDIPASALGLVIVPKRDDLRLVRTAEGVHVSVPGGLNVSRAGDVARRAVTTRTDKSLASMADWIDGTENDFEENRHRLLRAIYVMPAKQRNGARLEFARFLIAHQFAADGLGVLEIAQADDPTLAEDHDFKALQAAAHFLLGHYAQAAAIFDHDRFKGDLAVAPWRGGIAAARGDWVKAHHFMRDSRGIVSALPSRLRVRFSLIAAEAALAAKNADAARPWLDALGGLPLSEEDRLYLSYLNGHAIRLGGKPTAAKSIWRGIVDGSSRFLRAKAQFSVINSDYESGRIDRKKAIEELERLSFAWRGDTFEFDLRRRLGDLYAEEADFRTSLMQLRQAASHFKDVDGAEAIARDMRSRFRKLFLEGGADTLAPVTALALYEEFRELTPPGADGDEMIRRLADRLVKVDLLSEAGRLLDHQVRFRLTGLERARVGARLALIRLFDRKPQLAIEALKLSESEGIPEQLDIQRRYLKVRGFNDQGRGNEAIEVLAGDVSEAAELLRLEVHWKQGNWPEVARTVRRLVPQATAASLTDHEGALVLRWAVALTLQNDIDGLLLLRDRFATAIAKTSSAEAFTAIVGVEIGHVSDFKSLVKKAGDLGSFEAFMAGYREKLKNNDLSAIN